LTLFNFAKTQSISLFTYNLDSETIQSIQYFCGFYLFVSIRWSKS